MLNSLSKCLPVLFSAVFLAASLNADGKMENTKIESHESQCCNRYYLGFFGGGVYSNSSKIYQMGTALFQEAVGGPLAVEARGHTKKVHGVGFGGTHVGYEWKKCLDNGSCCTLSPALEAEGYWLRRHVKGTLFNQTDTDRLPEHDFVDSFHMMAGVYQVNFVLSLNNKWRLAPYVGVGVGATRLSLHSADSLQVRPAEAGVNHFNSRKNDSSWTFAGQAKAGLRYHIWRFNIFGEYRWMFVDSSNYIFGSTVYPFHAHTTPWNVKIQNMVYNAFAFGIQFDL